nr:unnamed protein product [Spirometra erinaceieuropaei]
MFWSLGCTLFAARYRGAARWISNNSKYQSTTDLIVADPAETEYRRLNKHSHVVTDCVEPGLESTSSGLATKLDAITVPGFSGSGHTYICNGLARRRFLEEIGTQISVVTPTLTDRRCPSPGLHLQTVNSSPISAFGGLSPALNIDLRRPFS